MYYGMTALEKKLHDAYMEKESKKAFNEAWAKTKAQMEQRTMQVAGGDLVKKGDVVVVTNYDRPGKTLAVVDFVQPDEHDDQVVVYYTTADELAKGLTPSGSARAVSASYCRLYKPE